MKEISFQITMTRTCKKLATCRLSLPTIAEIPDEQREPLMCLECLLIGHVEDTNENGKLVVNCQLSTTLVVGL